MALKLPSVWGSCLTLAAALVFGTGNVPGLVALVVICAIWIWYEAAPVLS